METSCRIYEDLINNLNYIELYYIIYTYLYLSLTHYSSLTFFLFHIYFTSIHCTGKYELNKLTSLPICGLIAQLVERASHRYRGGHGFASR